MASAILGALISSGLATAGNMALAKQQQKYSEDMMREQNDYNSPESQVSRLQAAGINPNSMSKGSLVEANTSASPLGYQRAEVGDLLGSASNTALALAQQKTEDAMRSVRLEEAKKNIGVLEETAKKLQVDTQYQNIINGYAAAQQELALQEGRFRIRLNWMQSRKINYECRELGYRLAKILPQELAESISREKLNLAQLPEILARIANYEADTALSQEKRNTEELVQAQAQEDITLTQENIEGQQIENKNAQRIADLVMKEYQATIDKLIAEGDLTKQEAYYYLFDLSKKNAVRFFGIPLMGAGGIRDMRSTNDIQAKAFQKYGQ